MRVEPGQPSPETADQVRQRLAKLREKEDAGELAPGVYAATSARLLAQLEQIEKRRQRFAIT